MKKTSFLRRLIISFLLIAVFPITLIASIFSYNTIQTTRASAQEQLDSAADLVSLQLDSLLNHMSYISIGLIGNDDFLLAAQQLSTTDQTRVQHESYGLIRAEFCAYDIVSSMYDVTYFNDKGHIVTSYNYNSGFSHTTLLDLDILKGFSWYAQVQDNFGLPVVLPIEEVQIPVNAGNCLSMTRAVRNPGKNVGYLRIDLEESILRQLLETDEIVDAELMIANADGTLIYKSEKFPAVDTGGLIDMDAVKALEEDYFLAQRSTAMNTQVYLTITHADAFAVFYRNLGVLLIQTLFLLGLTAIVVVVFSKDLASPLMALQKEMQETTLSNLHDAGNEKLFKRFDEISYVYSQFQDMRRRLDITMQREMDNQKMYMEERMNYLQAQINPHFMCNTLNVIGIMGIEHGAQDVQDACLQLSSLLRYSISDSDENKTTLEGEMQNIRDYLELMQLRYEHKLKYRVSYDEAMRDMIMPRLVLEPFVENIFAHAYGPQHKTVTVEVTGWLEGERWFVRIRDDGQGIPQEQLQRMREHISASCEQILAGKQINRKYGIGVENTLLRLCLYYGDSFRYTLESGENTGFEITLSANVKREKDHASNESNHSGR